MASLSSPGRTVHFTRRLPAELQPSGADAQSQPRTDSSTELQVTLNLEKGDDSLNSRNITFKADGGSLQIGRASKTERKQLVPAGDNMWISNPVISREHAVLSVEKDALVEVCLSDEPLCFYADYAQQLVVFLEDYRSSHGTFVNKVDIKTKGKAQLKSGDVVQFGDHVLRGTGMSFDPSI